MNFDQALAYLLSLGHETLTIKLGLENTETLLAALENPERTFPSVQIAGTNGKGSTAAFLDSICRAAGIRTGLFTSPHLISITERIRISGKQISEPEFARVTSSVRAVAEQLVAHDRLPTLPTFFEQVTAIALLAFADGPVELAILETGLGGRLDSTTAVRAEVVAITAVDMDHQEYLGNTLTEIAAEKAAIIHPGVLAIVAPQPAAVLEVITRRGESVGVQPRFVSSENEAAVPVATGAIQRNVSGTTADGRAIVQFKTPSATYNKVTLALRGLHQVDNAATAISIAEALCEKDFRISHEAIVQGIETATHPGRLEMWPGPPRFLFDGAHNPAAASALRNYLDEFIEEPIVMIFASMRDKALNEMMRTLFPRAAKVILTTLDNPRAASIAELMAAVPRAPAPTEIMKAAGVAEALELARRITKPNGICCVTGSLHLIGKAQELLTAAGFKTTDR
jgi:dihydrofolate synthase/folylpolyglutamate synthase